MKPSFLLYSFLLVQTTISGQTAEEILWKTVSTYRMLTNYVDEGTNIISYSNLPFPDTTTYTLALDRKGKVNQWFQKEKGGQISGSQYTISASDTLGTLSRLGTDAPSITCNMPLAMGPLGGKGGSMFFLLGSLFYPGFYTKMAGDTSAIQYYDTAKRLDDTTINHVNCYVVETRKTFVISQETADKQNFRRDSMQGILDLPVEQRGGPRTVAGPRSNARKYFIRKNDYMIVRMEDFHFKDGTAIVKFQSVLTLNPKYNVKDFAAYLKK
jgi:hypothetical protein